MVENRIFKLSTNAAIRFKKLLGKGDFGFTYDDFEAAQRYSLHHVL